MLLKKKKNKKKKIEHLLFTIRNKRIDDLRRVLFSVNFIRTHVSVSTAEIHSDFAIFDIVKSERVSAYFLQLSL